ncbi:MAG TPA: hypothetical protein VM938_05780 [Acidimicrobiales bacterium]|nr:hypothetical protein [Acidimicrobiales bacterium]
MPDDDWELENNPNSPAGEVEGFGRFATGVNRRRRRGQGGLARVVAIVIVLALVVPVVLGMVVALVG